MQVSRINHWNHGWHILKWRSSSQERWRPRLASHTASRGWCTRKQEFVSFHRAKNTNHLKWHPCTIMLYGILATKIYSCSSHLGLLQFSVCTDFVWLMFYLLGIINWIYPINAFQYRLQTNHLARLLGRNCNIILWQANPPCPGPSMS